MENEKRAPLLRFLSDHKLRYRKDWFVNRESQHRYSVVVLGLKIAISEHDLMKSEINEAKEYGYTLFRFVDNNDFLTIKQFIEDAIGLESCPICGKRIARLDTHLNYSVECRSKANEYFQSLRNKLLMPRKLMDMDESVIENMIARLSNVSATSHCKLCRDHGRNQYEMEYNSGRKSAYLIAQELEMTEEEVKIHMDEHTNIGSFLQSNKAKNPK